MDKPLRKIWWLWLPLLIALIQIAIEMRMSARALSVLHSENGPHELIEFLIVSAAFIVALSTLIMMKIKAYKWVATWFGLAALSCFFVAGEEVSWGQHFLHWSTPEYWMYFNDQGETNFHNTSSWLDQKPRLILFIGVVVGGLIIPALKRFKPSLVPARFEIIYPPATLGVIAGLVLGINLLEKLMELLQNNPFLHRGSEVEELYLFYFVLLYLITLRRRVMQN